MVEAERGPRSHPPLYLAVTHREGPLLEARPSEDRNEATTEEALLAATALAALGGPAPTPHTPRYQPSRRGGS